MDISRRDFVKLGAKGLVGAVIAASIPSVIRGAIGSKALAQDINAGGLERHLWGYVADNERCIGCGRCVVACKNENKVPWPPEYNRTWVERYVITTDQEVHVDSPNAGRDGFYQFPIDPSIAPNEIWKSFFVPKLCNQCEKPPCVTVCPVGATYKTDDGVILIDPNHCIGCRYCVQACPYGARYFNHETGIVDKCTWCYHRITKGMIPACVEVCPRQARVFGDLTDPNSRLNQMLAENRVFTLKPELGTEPKVSYIGFEKGVF